jgi:diguanylate cyclase (GGDEF)-like protein
MQVSTRLSSIASRRFDWTRPHTRDALILLAIGVATFGVAHFFDLPPHLLQFGLDHADWEMDDLIFVTFMLNIATMIYGFRRYRDLVREIRARSKTEREARKMARHDPLTGLPNRRFFQEKLDQCLRNAKAGEQLAILTLDLDGFKAINDTHGHSTGDKALSEFARRISSILRHDVFLARIGGDEFAIVMPAIESLDDPANLAGRIVTALAESFLIEDATVQFGVGIGIAIAPNDGSHATDLLKRADRALYRAKAAGRSCVRFFESEMDSRVERRIQIERELRVAIASDLIRPHYQPLVSLDGNRIIGFEALARWQSAALGHIAPDVFIPIAEETGLIITLGEQLFRRACLDAKSWPQGLTLSFNVSPIQLRDPTFGLRILSILGETGFSALQVGNRDHRNRAGGEYRGCAERYF